MSDATVIGNREYPQISVIMHTGDPEKSTSRCFVSVFSARPLLCHSSNYATRANFRALKQLQPSQSLFTLGTSIEKSALKSGASRYWQGTCLNGWQKLSIRLL
jgi:hypothetical protein